MNKQSAYEYAKKLSLKYRNKSFTVIFDGIDEVYGCLYTVLSPGGLDEIIDELLESEIEGSYLNGSRE
jgi:hypothetical protein